MKNKRFWIILLAVIAVLLVLPWLLSLWFVPTITIIGGADGPTIIFVSRPF